MICVTILSVLFSWELEEGVEKDDHHSTCQPKVDLRSIDGLRQEADPPCWQVPSVDMAVNKHMGVVKFIAVASYFVIKWCAGLQGGGRNGILFVAGEQLQKLQIP